VGVALSQLTSVEGTQGIVLLYRSAWAAPHLHCREIGATWTSLPGLPIPRAGKALITDFEAGAGGNQEDEGALFAVHLPTCSSLEFVINDGGPQHFRWDKAAGGANFSLVNNGVFLISGGRLDKVVPPPPAPRRPSISSASRTSVSLTWPAIQGSVRGYRVCAMEPY
jgi:hypothetical protein